jgi:outer membrane beta-barrel protein
MRAALVATLSFALFPLPAGAQPLPAGATAAQSAPEPAAAPAVARAPAEDEQQPAVGEDTQDVQRIHVVEVRPFTEAGRWELSLFGPAQVNARFTQHFGVAAELAYHLRENLAAQVGVVWFPIAQLSGLTEELVAKAKQQPLAADSLLLQAGAMAGLELMPVYGKLNIFDGKILRLGFYLNVGLGAAKTRLQLQQAGSATGRTFGDAGIRPLAALGAGFRVFASERFTVRLELRDLVYPAYVSRVNGCNLADTGVISTSGTGASGKVSAGCDVNAFGASDTEIRGNALIARDQIREPSADVMNNLMAYAGLSYLF